jgi:hypothetical protein
MIKQGPVGSQTNNTYDFDQWVTLTQSNAITASQVADAEDGTPYMMRSSQANASAQRFGRIQWLEKEDARELRGQTVVLSARARMSASTTLNYAIVEWTGTADTITKDVVNDWTDASLTTTHFFKSTSITVCGTGSTALTANTLADITSLSCTLSGSLNNVAVFFWTASTQAQNVTLDIGKTKLEKGSFATPFIHEKFKAQLDACERFYFKTYAYGTAVGTNFGSIIGGQYFNTGGSGAVLGITVKTPRMRRVTVSGDISLYDTNGSSGVSAFNGTTWTGAVAVTYLSYTDQGFSFFITGGYNGMNFDAVVNQRL